MILQRNIEINDKLPDEIYQKNKIDDKQSDENNQIVCHQFYFSGIFHH